MKTYFLGQGYNTSTENAVGMLLLAFLLIACTTSQEESPQKIAPSASPQTKYLPPIPPVISMDSLAMQAKGALDFCQRNNLNTSLCLLADMSVHSGQERFFVWDFQQKQLLLKGLVSHGCCSYPWGADYTKTNPTFSNVPDSHCSSLGKYMVGQRGVSQWGILVNYQLHGLEASNSNANKRTIVLHSWKDVPEQPVFPEGTPEGWGCPALANSKMRMVDSLLQKQNKPVLLWMYQ